MNILLTNDDGINSTCLQKLAERLGREHNVWVVAPVEERSACSHSITLHATIKCKKIGAQKFICWGTTADCVMISLLGFIPEKIDFVISGPNQGPNLGTDLIYSGTAAGARQAALVGIPGLAASIYAFKPPYNLDFPVEFIARNLDAFKKLWTPDHFININFPNNEVNRAQVAITIPSRRIYNDRLTTYLAPDDCLYCFLVGEYPMVTDNRADDSYAINQDKISVSPIAVYPASPEDGEKYKHTIFWKGEVEDNEIQSGTSQTTI